MTGENGGPAGQAGPGPIHKEVLFRFAGEDLFFDLSQDLFSSYQIDTGSRLLLKSLPSPQDIPAPRRILDIGCGTGVLGIAARSLYPEEKVQAVFQDRDALAAAFSRHNWLKNGLPPEQAQFLHGLSLEDTDRLRADWILCNWPAKAGEPVLRHFLRRHQSRLRPGGFTAMVIVRPLADRLRELLPAEGLTILREETGPGHQVFHLAPENPADPPEETLTPYIRCRSSFPAPPPFPGPYSLDTVYNLPNFDQRSRALDLALNLAGSAAPSLPPGPHLHWDPGQGHLPRLLASSAAPAATHLASRDRLQLLISRHNLPSDTPPAILHGIPGLTSLLHLPSPSPEKEQALITLPLETGPSAPPPAELHSLAEQLLQPGGFLLVFGRSAALAPLAKAPGPLRRVREKKKQGSRALLYQL